MVVKYKLPTQSYLLELFDYSPYLGTLAHKFMERDRFQSAQAFTPRNKNFSGKPAGTHNRRYVLVRIPGTTLRIHAQRIIWKMITGEDPSSYIDHINGDKQDNRWCNLREATSAQNQHNRGVTANNLSGFKGVGFHKSTGMWRARICVDMKQKHLGVFHTPEEAYAAYCEAAKKYHREFANFGGTNGTRNIKTVC